MGLPIDLPGLKQFLSEVPDGSLITVEGGLEVIKSVFVQNLCLTACRQNRQVVYVTSRGREEASRQLAYYLPERIAVEVVEDRTPGQWRARMRPGSLLVVDSFSYIMFGRPVDEVRAALEEVQRACKSMQAIVVVVMDQGLLDERALPLASHLSDAVILFQVREGGEGVARFLRIPKWTNGRSVDMNINFTFDDKRINVDLRQRVV